MSLRCFCVCGVSGHRARWRAGAEESADGPCGAGAHGPHGGAGNLFHQPPAG